MGMESDTVPDSLSVPPDLLADIRTAADEENRPAGDVLRDAVKRYVRESRWQRTLAKGQARAKALGFTEADVPRLIAEFREEQR
jgi:metal-responsive CopG/Arc/MetJ family transcriptional regulator